MPFRISSYPGSDGNPYLDLFYAALEPYGVVRATGFTLSMRWLTANRAEIDAIHFHWPEWLWARRKRSRVAGLRVVAALMRLELLLSTARVCGIRLIWTVHNIDPHGGGDWADRMGQRMLARHCDLVITHSAATEAELRRRVTPRGRVVVMPHGSYVGHYPAPRPRAAILADLGLADERPILCCVGMLRDYKGIDLACQAFARLKDEVRLVIAGSPHPSFDLAALERYAASEPGLTLVAHRLDDQEFVDILSVADTALLPYRQVTGSGALLAAWSAGCGVVASDHAFFRDMLPEESDAGRLFPSGDVEALVAAITSYLDVSRARRSAAARAMASQFAWERCVIPVGEIVQSWNNASTRTHTSALNQG